MDSIEKRFEKLSGKYQQEVSDFIDFLLQKMEKEQKLVREQQEQKDSPNSSIETQVKVRIQKEPIIIPPLKPKNELNEQETELDEAPELFPCPHCKCVVRKDWEECPFCNKKILKKKN